MAIGSGLGGFYGAKPETTYGTYVAPDHFLEVNSATFNRKAQFVQGGGLAAGRYTKASSRYTKVNQEAEATIECEVPSTKFGIFLNNLMGGTVTPVQQGATAAYLQTYTLADNKGKALSMQFGVPDTGGTIRPYSLLGSKMTSMDLSCGYGEQLVATMNFDARDFTEAQSAVSPSYTIGNIFGFTQMNVKVGVFGSEAAVTGVKKFSLHLERPMNTDMHYANQGALKGEPILNDWHEITGSIETDYVTKADFADRVTAGTPVSVVWEFIGPLIASTYYQTFRVTLSATVFTAGDPTLEGPDVVSPTFNFAALDDQTNPPVKVEYMSTDITL